MSTVGSQDTTGPMTRDELKELACLGFSADLVMQPIQQVQARHQTKIAELKYNHLIIYG